MVSSVDAADALGRLLPVERLWIEEFRDRLSAQFPGRIRDLRLFGSKARGEDGRESDIDLLVLVDVDDPATHTAVVDLATSISAWLSPHVFEFDAYHAPVSRASGFYKEIRRESVRL